MFKLKLKETNNQIKKMIAEAIKEEFDLIIKTQLTQGIGILRLKFRNFILQSDEFSQLTTGRVPGELGLPYGSMASYFTDVINDASQEIDLEYITKTKYSIALLGFREGWQDRIIAKYPGIVSSGGFEVPWVKWLLTEGSKTIISGYRFKPMEAGRSLQGIMVKKGDWRVPAEFAGTEEDNFITRLFDDFRKEIAATYKEILSV